MTMELGEHPRQVFLRVDRLVKGMERVGRPTLEKDIDIVLLTGLSSQYDAEVRMLESCRMAGSRVDRTRGLLSV